MRCRSLLLFLLAFSGWPLLALAQAPDPSWQTAPLGWDEPPKDAVKTPSGLVTRVIQPGTGTDRPRAEDVAVVRYSIWKSDGKILETWAKRGEPRTFPVGKQIAGWQEGLQLMTVGERRVFWIPEKLAFKGRPGKPRGTLVWDAELLEIRRHPPAPPDVKAPPKDASRTPSGLAWKELAPGTGSVRPKKTAAVMVHYAGWTTDGKAFDSTYIDGEPTSFTLDSVIPGWTEGLQLMTVGQKVRFWIPQALAYAGKKGKPKGMLVFDVELLQVANP
jgi:peptidylprolyl isomerase